MPQHAARPDGSGAPQSAAPHAKTSAARQRATARPDDSGAPQPAALNNGASKFFKSPEGNVWSMCLVNGRWYSNQDGVVREIKDLEWLSGRWLWTRNRWVNLDDANIQVNKVRSEFEYLATVLCPMYERWRSQSWEFNGTVNLARIKEWSHNGCTDRYGDVGNRCMYLVLQVAHRYRFMMGLAACDGIQQLGEEKASDLLEATMGLRWMYPQLWQREGDVVDSVCCATYEFWNESRWVHVWDNNVLVDEIVRRYWSDVQMYSAQHAARHQRQAFATSCIFAELEIILNNRKHLVHVIKSFL